VDGGYNTPALNKKLVGFSIQPFKYNQSVEPY